MFFSKKNLICNSCKREIGEMEKIALVTIRGELNGMTNLRKFAELNTILCTDCFETKTSYM